MSKESESKYHWLQKYWHWKIPDGKPVVKPVVKEKKYKVVKKGEEGKLRTPYRPDKIFR